MRAASIPTALLVAALLAAPARADRDTAVVIGPMVVARATGASFSAAGKAEVRWLGGGRLTLSFEDPPPPCPPQGGVGFDARLAPELLVGFLSDDVHAEGYAGAGLRGELWIASTSPRSGRHARTAVYAAARALAIGDHQDGAAELVIGEYLSFSGHRRFGWEGGAVIRKRGGAPADEARELDALISIYVGW